MLSLLLKKHSCQLSVAGVPRGKTGGLPACEDKTVDRADHGRTKSPSDLLTGYMIWTDIVSYSMINIVFFLHGSNAIADKDEGRGLDFTADYLVTRQIINTLAPPPP